MEFWKCLNEGKGLFSPEELELPLHNRSKLSGHEPETLYETSNLPLVSNRESIEGQEFIRFGFPDTLGRTRQANYSDPSRDVLSNQIGLNCYAEVASPIHTSPDVSQEKQLGSRMPSFFVGSDSVDLAKVDLKLGGLADCIGAREGESSRSAASSVPTKRSRLTNSYSQTPVCQVYGCNKDLSSYKNYYKRHKVCDAHTKTATVIVKGIEQRFCQQCSRFHLLAEFDDGKRSCRKRLANHNERRRKSPGTRFLRSSSIRTSFLFQEMLPTSIPGPSKPEPGKWFSHIKYEDPIMDSDLLLNFHDNISAGTLDKSAGFTVPNDHDFSHTPDPSSALSLLSAQSLKASNPSMATLSHHNYSSSQGFTEKIGPTTTVFSGGVGADLKVPDSNKYSLSSGQGTVVDLLQLSSHLQMVEHKRNLMH